MNQKIKYLDNIQRIQDISESVNNPNQVLLLPEEVEIDFSEKDMIITKGLGKLDKKEKDLLTVIKNIDESEGKYEETNILSPRTYLESLVPIPKHLTVQGIIILKVDEDFKDIVSKLKGKFDYAKHEADNLWIGKPLTEIKQSDTIILMNRRVGGWDGSEERPVIELLGAGGHVGSVFNQTTQRFTIPNPVEIIKIECEEEIGLKPSNLSQLGSFFNTVSSELVLLFGIEIESKELIEIQNKAWNNIAENTNGIYLGEIKSVMNNYLEDATYFAGGEKAKPTNFPSNDILMNNVYKELNIDQ